MYMRIYFLLPNVQLTSDIIDKLAESGISRKQIHVMVRNKVPGVDLPEATKWQKKDAARIIESFLWVSNLAIFFIALIIMLSALISGSYFLALGCIGIMIVSFLTGDLFALFVPRVHLSEFEHALSHGEVLLMIDTLKKKAPEIEEIIERYCPSAIPGGSCWTISSIGI